MKGFEEQQTRTEETDEQQANCEDLAGANANDSGTPEDCADPYERHFDDDYGDDFDAYYEAFSDDDNHDNRKTAFLKGLKYVAIFVAICMVVLTITTLNRSIEARDELISTLYELNDEYAKQNAIYEQKLAALEKELEANDLYVNYQSLFAGINYTDGMSLEEILSHEQSTLILLLSEEITIENQKISIREDLIAKLEVAYDATSDEDIKLLIFSSISINQEELEKLRTDRDEAQQMLDEILELFEGFENGTIPDDFDDWIQGIHDVSTPDESNTDYLHLSTGIV